MIRILLFLVAFVPMILAFVFMRNTEKRNRQSWFSLILMFLWGALIASSMAVILERITASQISNFVLLAVVVAPVIEEIAKPLGLRIVKKDILEVEDGLIYGAVVGFGFAATENLLYGLQFFYQGWLVIFALFYIRTIGSAVLHASATAFTGYGYSLKLTNHHSFVSILPYFVVAIVIHAVFNVFAVTTILSHQIIGVVIATVFTTSLMLWIRKKIQVLDGLSSPVASKKL